MFVVPEGISKSLPGGTRAGTRVETPVGLIDLYPTLVNLCDLGENKALEGQSLVPLLEDPNAKWDRPALTTHGCKNHALRTSQWRYIRYADGSEEIYHNADPNEWTNLALKTESKSIRQKFSKWFPRVNAGSAEYEQGKKK
jgi:arylsulfatase A-like enzyme